MFDTQNRNRPNESLDFLDGMPPGILLAAALLEVDVDQLTGPDRVTVLRAHDRMVAFHGAQRARAIASLTTADELDGFELDLVFEAAAAETRLALRLTRRAADTELSTALDLRGRLPPSGRDLDVHRDGPGDRNPRGGRGHPSTTHYFPASGCRCPALHMRLPRMSDALLGLRPRPPGRLRRGRSDHCREPHAAVPTRPSPPPPGWLGVLPPAQW